MTRNKREEDRRGVIKEEEEEGSPSNTSNFLSLRISSMAC